jgi:hypothetical protein
MDLHSTIRRILKEETQEKKILSFPSLEFFDEDREVAWNIIQKIIERKGNPPYSIEGDLDLRFTSIKSLGNLQSVGGNLNLEETPIQSLGNLKSVGGYLDLYNTSLESLGNLQSVGGYLDLQNTSIESLGNLKSVGGNLGLLGTPLSKMYSEEEILQIVNVDGRIYL